MKKVITIEPAAAHQPKKRLRVAAYCRVSTASDEQLVSLETQKAHYECKCQNKYVSFRQVENVIF